MIPQSWRKQQQSFFSVTRAARFHTGHSPDARTPQRGHACKRTLPASLARAAVSRHSGGEAMPKADRGNTPFPETRRQLSMFASIRLASFGLAAPRLS